MIMQRPVGAARPSWLAAADATTWIVAVGIFCGLRLNVAGVEDVLWSRVAVAGLSVGLLHGVIGSTVQLYHGRAQVGSVDEAMLLGATTLTAGTMLTAASAILTNPSLPRSVPVAATFLTLAAAAAIRVALRRRVEAEQERLAHWKATPCLVVGAGPGGRAVIEAMLADSGSEWRPVGILDDRPSVQRLRIRGCPVLGGTGDLAEVARRTGARDVVLADPVAGDDGVRDLVRDAATAGLSVKVLPRLDELAPKAAISDLRDLDVTDLLGRHELDTDVSSIARYLRGRRVLVTGAGGSIGSELCRQIRRFEPSELIMLDRDESALHAVQLSLDGRALLDTTDVVLADIRDRDRVLAIFRERAPDVVFHAAALKHLPMLEQYPGEAVQTNVWGSLNVLEASRAAGVERFVNVSTDKAADPICVLGYSKRLAERLTATVASEAGRAYLSVRFGNVLGSRGSVLTTFAAQIQSGGPVTVTDPNVTRYFMTVPEAVELVIQAAAIGEPGQALVLDMGEPVRIAHVAQQMMALAGRQVPVVYTGLRPGEKLHEDLLAADEVDRRPRHPLVSQVGVPPLPLAQARALDARGEAGQVTATLAALCRETPRPASTSMTVPSLRVDEVVGGTI